MNKPDRISLTHLDGTKLFRSAGDTDARNENEVAEILGRAWDCQLVHFAALSTIDWYAVRYERIVGVLELKSRTHFSSDYATVFLGVRKWLGLIMASVGMGVPGLFVVRFKDGVFKVDVRDVDASQVTMSGWKRPSHATKQSDIEPLIEVPIKIMDRVNRFDEFTRRQLRPNEELFDGEETKDQSGQGGEGR